MKKKKNSYSLEYRISLGDLANEPLISGLLEEMERLENIRNSIYKEYQNGSLVTEYTNKAGATNSVVNPAVKEYKAYCQQFTNICKAISAIVKEYRDILPGPKETADEFEKLIGIGANGK